MFMITITGPALGKQELADHIGQFVRQGLPGPGLLDTTGIAFDPNADDESEHPFDYVAETDVTASGVYGGDQSDAQMLAQDLMVFIQASKRLDKHKKVLFRKRSNADAGLPVPRGPFTNQFFPGQLNAPGDQRDSQAELLHGVIGVCTEAGELAEVIFNKIAKGEDPDLVNVREEIGDVLWYLARLVKWSGTTFLTEMRRNIKKLRARHGDAGFNAERDANRNLDAEHALLAGEGSTNPAGAL